METSHIIINGLLIGGFTVTAYDAFKNFNPFSALSMVVSMSILLLINP